MTTTIHYLDQFVVDDVQTATGNVLENDVLFDPAYTLTVSVDGTTFQDPTGGITLGGQYGDLQIDAAGNYVYTPDSTLEVFGSTLTDTFSYRLEYPDGTIEQAEFNVFITASGEGVPEVTTLTSDLLFNIVDDGGSMPQPKELEQSEPSSIGHDETSMRQAMLEHTFEDDLPLLLSDQDTETDAPLQTVTNASDSFSIDDIMFNDTGIIQQPSWTDEDGNVGF